MSFVTKYQIEREKYWNTIGIYFCSKAREDQCEKQCEECNKYFENKLIKEQMKK